LLHLLFAPEVPLTLLLPLHLAAVLLRGALFHATTRLRAVWATSILVFSITIFFTVRLILLGKSGNTRPEKQT